MKIICNFCKKEFERPLNKINYGIKKGWKFYCSEDCKTKAKSVKIKCKCANCGKEIKKLPNEIKHSKHGNVFCNKSCACSYNNSHFRLRENNPNWQGGKTSSHTHRTIAFRNYKHECMICGYNKTSALQVHHIDLDHSNNSLDNLIILCANCHCLVHYDNLEITEDVKKQRILLKK